MTAPPLPRAARGSRPVETWKVTGRSASWITRPERVEHRQVVVRVLDVVPAPDRLARQREDAEAELRDALDLGDRALEIAGGQRGRGRHAVDVGAERLPRPVVPDAALRHARRRDRAWPTSRGPCSGRSPRRRCRRGPCRARRSSGSAPARWRSRSSPSRASVRRRSGRWPSETRHFTPFVVGDHARARGRGTSRRCASPTDRAGSLAWQSAETMKYLCGSPGRARARPARVSGRRRAASGWAR